MFEQTLTLSDYLTTIKLVLNHSFDHDVWVVCEIQNVSHKAGHYYFELGQSGQTGLAANCRGTLWRSYANGVLKKFEHSTGATLAKGLTVKLKGRASFHAVYGFSFNIIDIDPNYTLGEIAKAYLDLKNKLIEMGLFDLNKHLPLPFDLQKIAVIAPERGAGLGDFQAEADRLAQAGVCQFDYHFATFQGDTAPQSLRLAIGQSVATSPDLLVIIRGGGAVTDLAYLNDYELSALVCETDVPVWVGIGHERDKGILDEIAHTAFDTPSKVIIGIEKYLAHRWQTAKSHFDDIVRHSQSALNLEKSHLHRLSQQVQFGTKSTLTAQKTATNHHYHAVKAGSFDVVGRAKQNNQTALTAHKLAYHHLNFARQETAHLRDVVLGQHPKNVLAKGYALIKQGQRFIKSINDLQSGELSIVLQDGEIVAKVDKAP